MMVATRSTAGASSAKAKWDAINWHAAKAVVYRLQSRIAKAIKENRWGKVKALQYLLTHSHSAKLLAVKRVSSNTGSKTPGVDGVIWKTAQDKMQAVTTLKRRGYQAQPLRRIYIPKKNGKLRPLGIPTMRCRAMQALYLMALTPISETTADKNSYGFRPYRSCADAIEQCFRALAKKNVQLLLANIRELIKANSTAPEEVLIRQLNARIRGWANYYRHVIKEYFEGRRSRLKRNLGDANHGAEQMSVFQ